MLEKHGGQSRSVAEPARKAGYSEPTVTALGLLACAVTARRRSTRHARRGR
ncbi:hypothetical protein K701_07100 [Streptomyces fradiae ATCC 10745 = DSM 40063]|uniref:Uncharacterized protein n=1 Tax=Streptomyces fradiae ATCC 10745 = DSM 40063 TaxID=1319510 RepID=A0ABQ6XYL5_STRFR|nr:hypothetical protein K701_07100 [Streptomyces fradiae ATCC 10745 = DSM 40063]